MTKNNLLNYPEKSLNSNEMGILNNNRNIQGNFLCNKNFSRLNPNLESKDFLLPSLNCNIFKQNPLNSRENTKDNFFNPRR